MDRHWLITWTCYGTWLPGDARGFVSEYRDQSGQQVIHNVPGTPVDADMPLLEAHARREMNGPPVSLDGRDAECLIQQYRETARIRHWTMQAASVMFNHTHVLVSVEGDPEPSSILETLKSWATRALKKARELPPNGTFWTAKGSKRKLPNEEALVAGVIYVVRKQWKPLAVCYNPRWQETLDEYDRSRAACG